MARVISTGVSHWVLVLGFISRQADPVLHRLLVQVDSPITIRGSLIPLIKVNLSLLILSRRPQVSNPPTGFMFRFLNVPVSLVMASFRFRGVMVNGCVDPSTTYTLTTLLLSRLWLC
jgi:hypothetical protein